MRVIVTEALVDNALAFNMAPDLTQLLAYAFGGQHAFLFDTEAALEKCVLMFAPQLQDQYRKRIEEAILASEKCVSNVVTVRVQHVAVSEWAVAIPRLNLHDANALLAEPLAILLEDEANDWAFLSRILPEEERALILEAREKRWLEVVHGGGTKLLPILSQRLSKPNQGLRTFVMFDSDRMHPDEFATGWTPPPEAKNDCHAIRYAAALIGRYENHYWCLKRRFIECYMPLNELQQWSEDNERKGVYAAFARMNASQQWYYNMKTGFEGDNAAAKLRQGMLFATVSSQDRVALAKGFTKQLADHYVKQDVKREFQWDAAARAEVDEILPHLMRLL